MRRFAIKPFSVLFFAENELDPDYKIRQFADPHRVRINRCKFSVADPTMQPANQA